MSTSTSTTVYSIEALSTGAGRNGHVTTSDGAVDLDMAAPKELGGSGDGFNPEQLFAAGYAACFHSALQGVARGRKLTLTDSSVGARVELVRDEIGFIIAVTLEVVLPSIEHELAQELAAAAHAMCPYSRATEGNIAVTLIVSND
jgi:lipoyl-dependent peroxiredoxin